MVKYYKIVTSINAKCSKQSGENKCFLFTAQDTNAQLQTKAIDFVEIS